MNLRKITDKHGATWYVNPKKVAGAGVWPIQSGTTLLVVGRLGHGIELADTEKALYILTMRNPAKHRDPLPEWMERPRQPYQPTTVSAAEFVVGSECRLAGKMAEDTAAHGWQVQGWKAQDAIAREFYAAHVVRP
jgi:hypothetical protein